MNAAGKDFGPQTIRGSPVRHAAKELRCWRNVGEMRCDDGRLERMYLILLALPREADEPSKIKALLKGLGQIAPIEFQCFSQRLPKPFLGSGHVAKVNSLVLDNSEGLRCDLFGAPAHAKCRTIARTNTLLGVGDRVRLSQELERDAIEVGYVETWQHKIAKRKPDGSRGCSEGPSGGRQ